MSHFDPIDPKQNFAELEHEIIKFWEENDTFRKSIDQRPEKDSYVFFDGPPFATGLPHYGHILAGTLKDVVPRFFTMRGKRIERRFGWDCHGVPVEFEVEKENNIGGKPEIEKMGVGKYNQLCRNIVMRCADQWEDTVSRMGRWVDFQNDYKTMDPDYMESMWWVFKSLWDKGLIYEGEKIVPYSPKLGSPLSNFEAGLNYKDTDDPAVTIKFELADEPGTYFLAWTTTPWTLPSNLALAVNPKMEYVKIKAWNAESRSYEFLISGKTVFEQQKKRTSGNWSIFYLQETRESEAYIQHPTVVSNFKGKDLIGKKYNPLFPFFKDHQNAFQILGADFVSEEEGTGIVHMAPTGVDDVPVLQAHDISLIYPFDENCYFDDTIPELKGKYFRYDPVVPGSKENNANNWVVEELKKSGNLFHRQQIRHSYPHCWRTDSALMYRGINTWFVRVEKIKTEMVKLNQQIHWMPEFVGQKRFANWLEDAKDWAISRNRYWGAPLPVWKCTQCEHIECIGSVAELQEKGFKKTEIFVMRHGEATHNVDGTVNSDPKTPISLTEKGKEQVKKSAKELQKCEIDLIFSSPLLRTRETAEIVAEEIGYSKEKIRYVDELQEVDVGNWEGKNISEFRKIFHTPQERYELSPHEGESGRDVFVRVGKFLQEIHKTHPGKNILLVTHGDPARYIRKFFTNETTDALFKTDKNDRPQSLLSVAEYFSCSFDSRPQNDQGELDLHRPAIDEVELKCKKCKSAMRRISEVLDCWFESGSMPYGQSHYPFENKDYFEKNFPADFIGEGLDQTRGWFYTLHVLSTALFNKPAFKNVVVNGIVLAEDGQKMSKSKKNYPDPHEVFEKFGVDAVRFTLINSPVVRADNMRFSENAVLQTVRSVFLPLWNAYSFFVTYANIDNWKPDENQLDVQDFEKLDRWILTELRELIRMVTKEMDVYNLAEALRDITGFLEKLTNSYIRRSRRRFWKSGMEQDKEHAFAALHKVLTCFCQVLAPFCPFMTEHIYKNLTKEESVHLTDFPDYQDLPEDPELRQEFEVVETIISLGLSLRAQKKIKVRQPLGEMEVFLSKKLPRRILQENEDIILQELNVKKFVIMDSAEKICHKVVKPDARVLGPKFGKEMQQIIQEAKSGNFTEEKGGIRVGKYFLEEGAYTREFIGQEGFDVASEKGIVVAVNTELTPELKNEGLVRELIRFVQEARKEAGFDVADRILLGVRGDEKMLSVLKEFQEEIGAEVLAEEVDFGKKDLGNGDFEKQVEMEGVGLEIVLTRK